MSRHLCTTLLIHHNLSGRIQVRLSKQLTELEKQFYGSSMAYDKAMKGEEPLAAALLRNVYQLQAGREGMAALLERYVKR